MRRLAEIVRPDTAGCAKSVSTSIEHSNGAVSGVRADILSHSRRKQSATMNQEGTYADNITAKLK
jgi:hypothetical protein